MLPGTGNFLSAGKAARALGVALQRANGCCSGSGTGTSSTNAYPASFLTVRLRALKASLAGKVDVQPAKGLSQLKCPAEALRGTITPGLRASWGFASQILHFDLSLSPVVALSGLLRACVCLQGEDPRSCSCSQCCSPAPGGWQEGFIPLRTPSSSPPSGEQRAASWRDEFKRNNTADEQKLCACEEALLFPCHPLLPPGTAPELL